MWLDLNVCVGILKVFDRPLSTIMLFSVPRHYFKMLLTGLVCINIKLVCEDTLTRPICPSIQNTKGKILYEIMYEKHQRNVCHHIIVL